MSEQLICEECERISEEAARGWHAYLIDANDEAMDEVVFFCPICVEREFQPGSRRPSA